MDAAKKEIIIAGLLGFFLGILGATIAVNIKNIKLQTAFIKPTSQTPAQTGAPTPTPAPQTISLAVTTPDDESVTSKDSVTIEGKTDPKGIIVIVDENDEKVVSPDTDGSFKSQVSLTPEENIIIISAYKDGQQETVQRLVVYDKPEE